MRLFSFVHKYIFNLDTPLDCLQGEFYDSDLDMLEFLSDVLEDSIYVFG